MAYDVAAIGSGLGYHSTYAWFVLKWLSTPACVAYCVLWCTAVVYTEGYFAWASGGEKGIPLCRGSWEAGHILSNHLPQAWGKTLLMSCLTVNLPQTPTQLGLYPRAPFYGHKIKTLPKIWLYKVKNTHTERHQKNSYNYHFSQMVNLCGCWQFEEEVIGR